METYRQTVLIYNPYAGGLRRGKHALRRSIELLDADGITVDSIATTGPGHAGEIARCAVERGADLILVAGGDGTINEAINGMAHSGVPLGILPAGTANVFANELGIGKSMEQAAAVLVRSSKENVALGRLSNERDVAGRYFLLMAGAGLDADIVFHLKPRMKETFGKAAYWIGGLSKVGSRIPQFTVQAGGREYRASFALASRVRNYGGDLEIAPSISLLDDEFELVLFEGESSLGFLKYMLAVVVHQHQTMPGITILRTRQAVFSAPTDAKIHVQVDGEYAGTLPANVEIVPNALTILVPPGFHARRPASVENAAWTT
ncbi:MAG TPA: diacylglycerol kinase family protein [Bryobacteraceae bacterium]|nr:diacylglycerol kinase family protein [Bryobacteraceae bacterium]